MKNLGEIFISKLLGEQVEVVEYLEKKRPGDRCLQCAYLGHCRGTKYFEIRRLDAEECSRDSREDKKNVFFKNIRQLYKIPEELKTQITQLLTESPVQPYKEIYQLLENQYSHEVHYAYLNPNTKFFSKLLGKELIVLPNDGKDQCSLCAYNKICEKLRDLVKLEAGQCKLRYDLVNFIEVVEKYEVETEVYDELIEIEKIQGLENNEKRSLQIALLDSLYLREMKD